MAPPPSASENGSAAAAPTAAPQPTVTIDGKVCPFAPGEMIIQVANREGQAIPQYCYHDGLSIVASCRICLAEVWQPNPRNDNKLEPIPKLVPTCQTACAPGMVVYTNSPKAVANQKSVMEYLLINHPLDCPVCDQAGECSLQDYSYEYGRGQSRFEETKVKQPKKDLGGHVYLYSDRCIMCTRCVRFTREVSGTAELMVAGRGNKEEIDVFPGRGIDNPLSANVIDLCPVGALLDKDFLFAQRVWFLRSTPSIDGITASGDNILIEHNQGKVYRLKPRTNMNVNKWWITDEVRYGWKFVHADERLTTPLRRQFGVQVPSDWNRAYADVHAGLSKAASEGGRLALLVSPMLSCEDAYALAEAVRQYDPRAIIGVGPIPSTGSDQFFPHGVDENSPKAFRISAEKAPNARGVRRVLEALVGQGNVHDFAGFRNQLSSAKAVVVTGNYPSDWITPDLMKALEHKFVVAVDTLENELVSRADVVLPGATWAEKAGTFENWNNLLQAFEQAIPVVGMNKGEAQIGLDLQAVHEMGGLGGHTIEKKSVVWEPAKAGQVPSAKEVPLALGRAYNAADLRAEMAERFPALGVMATGVAMPVLAVEHEPAEMAMVEL